MQRHPVTSIVTSSTSGRGRAWYSCYLTAAHRRRTRFYFSSGSLSPGAFFLLLVDLGSGAAVSGMRIEINTGRQKASRVQGRGGVGRFVLGISDPNAK